MGLINQPPGNSVPLRTPPLQLTHTTPNLCPCKDSASLPERYPTGQAHSPTGSLLHIAKWCGVQVISMLQWAGRPGTPCTGGESTDSVTAGSLAAVAGLLATVAGSLAAVAFDSIADKREHSL